MKTTAYQTYSANRATAAAAAKKAPIVARALNLAHDPQEQIAKTGNVYTVINGYDAKNNLYKVVLFGTAAREAINSLTKGDYVEFTGRQQEIPASYNATKALASIKVDAGDRGSFRVLAASQDKQAAKSAGAVMAKADAGFTALADADDLPF